MFFRIAKEEGFSDDARSIAPAHIYTYQTVKVANMSQHNPVSVGHPFTTKANCVRFSSR